MTATFDFNRPIAAPTLLSRLFRARPKKPAAVHEADAARTRRDFIMDRMNDDAFASDYDVQAMMAHFPRDF